MESDCFKGKNEKEKKYRGTDIKKKRVNV